MNRRRFISRSLLAGAGAYAAQIPAVHAAKSLFGENYLSRRPQLADRTFTSTAVENTISSLKPRLADPELAWMFENCYPNTLDTTVDFEIVDGKPDTFIITGDIDAMWLRDSTAQVWPYLPLIQQEKGLKMLIAGLINRQAKCVLKDPYANAFYKDLTKESEWKSDSPEPIAGVHERKWEIDSLCYVVRLAHGYFEYTNDVTPFDQHWREAMQLLVKTLRTEQRKDGTSPYFFVRRTDNVIDAPPFRGTGQPVKPTGMICSMFRPSDDSTVFPYLIPSNLMAVQALHQLADIFRRGLHDEMFAADCESFAREVETGVKTYGIVEHPGFGKIYAYEVDGYGGQILMDDANVPSLMSLAYLGVHSADDPLYVNTRRFLISNANPWYLTGNAAEGQGSPHTGKRAIWPMGIILRALTSTSDEEIAHCLQLLKTTHAGTGFMHESFDKDDASLFSRKWFAWANTLFGELVLKLADQRPLLVLRD